MHEHDQDIIMALAEGTLDAVAAEAAESAISACVECSADLELQRFALASLEELDTPYLTATESADLHTTLRRELSLDAPQQKTERRGFAWGRWVPVLGIAAVFLVAVAALPSMLGGGDDDSADMTMAANATTAAPETTAAAATDERAFEMELETGEAAPQLDDSAGSDGSTAADSIEEAAAETTAAPETTEAPATTTTMSAMGGLTETLEYLGPVDEIDTTALRDEIASDWERVNSNADTVKLADPEFALCLLETASPEVAPDHGIAADSAPVVLGIVSDDAGEELVLVAYVPEEVEQTVFLTHRLWICQVAGVVSGD